MCKFQDFSASQILRELNFCHFEAPKTAILTFWTAQNFALMGDFDIFKCEMFPKIKIQNLQIVKVAVFDFENPAKIDFPVNSRWQKNC